MDNNSKKVWAILYDEFCPEKIKKIFVNIPKYLFNTTTGFIVGLLSGFYLCYIYRVTTGESTLEWMTIAKLSAAILAIIAASIIVIKNYLSLALERKKYLLKENEFKEKNIQIEKVSDKLASDLGPHLNKKLFQADTIYEMRAKHYAEEKEFIALNYIEQLKNRVLSLLKNDQRLTNKKIKNIKVILDSGTTITNIFDKLGKEAYDNKDHWTKKKNVLFYTNSVRGVLTLFRYRDQSSRYSEIPLNCNIFPGKILSPYEAIADEETVKSIINLKDDKSYVIFITTGNYLIFNTKTPTFIPIARAGFHPYVKAAGMHIADEIHVVAPLGKILTNSRLKHKNEKIEATLDRFNKCLGYSKNNTDESMEEYSLVTPHELLSTKNKKLLDRPSKTLIKNLDMFSWKQKSVLYTSSRTPDGDKRFWLADHSSTLQFYLDASYDPKTTVLPNEGPPYLQSFSFDGLPFYKKSQVKHEIPHDNLRDKLILGDFFKVDPIEKVEQ
ncbi:MAG: hypothetical protein GY699_13405 [Desulfobacteraceae bacterium]|nr:hypothetical protein [Desulfobacteraceae bacterium]